MNNENMNNEYDVLCTEIKDWQDRRFTVLTGSIGLVTAILGLKIFEQPARGELWPWISSLLLFALSSACLLTWYAGRANAKLAAYLICFHERPSLRGDGWQSRLHRLKHSGIDRLNLNRIMVCIYLALATVSVLLPVLQQHPNRSGWIVIGIGIGIFLSSLSLLALSTPKGAYINQWDTLPAPANPTTRNAEQERGSAQRVSNSSGGGGPTSVS